MKRDQARRQQQHGGNHGGGDRLRLAVAVRMVVIRRRLGHDESAPDDHGTENVRERFHRVGDERLRMAENAGEKFRERQHDVRGEAEERGAQAAMEAIGRHGELLTTKHTKRHKRISTNGFSCSSSFSSSSSIFCFDSENEDDDEDDQIKWQNIRVRHGSSKER